MKSVTNKEAEQILKDKGIKRLDWRAAADLTDKEREKIFDEVVSKTDKEDKE